jgi:O-antigen ligase
MPADWVDESETGIAVRAYSVVQNPNVLGALLAMGSLISGSLALSRAFSGARRLLLAGACLVQLLGLAVTFSRGAWLGLVAGLLAMAVLAYRRYLPAIVGLGVVAWFAAPRVFIQRLMFTFSEEYALRSSAGLGRMYRWDVSLHHILEHPVFGMGLGTFGGTAAFMFGYWALWVDNYYLQLAAEGGLLLLVFFLWLLLRGAKGLVRGYRVSRDPFLKALSAGTFGAFVAVAVANAFEADWETLAVGVEYWFLAGLVTSAALDARSSQEAAPHGTEVAD